MLSIQTNVNSLIAQQNLGVNSAFQSQTITRLTSGYRINSSGDDAAGLSIANHYRAKVAELAQGVRNANDATSILQTMDGGLNNIGQILNRMKTLATEAATGTQSKDGYTALDAEYQGLLTEIDRQADSIGLGAGSGSEAKKYVAKTTIFVGGGSDAKTATTGATVAIDLTGKGVDTTTLTLKGGALTDATGANSALDTITAAFTALAGTQGVVGQGENTVNYASQLAQTEIANFSAADSRIRDTDVAAEAANLSKASVLQQASIAAMAQANSAPQAVLSLLK
jgi:flagellin